MTEARQPPEALRRQIEETRRELGDTVEALSHKTDVKEQARLKKEEVQERVRSSSTPLAAAIGGLLALLLVLRLVRRR